VTTGVPAAGVTVLLVATLAAVPALAATQPAAGGVGILAAATDASAVTATGVLENVEKIDVHGYVADLHVDDVLAGAASLGDVVRIAWDELAARRPPRFSDHDRVLVVLDPLPTQSLWRKRFPEAAAGKARVLVVANGGRAFLREPSGPTVDLLGHYLAVIPAMRTDSSALDYLVELVAHGDPSLAGEVLGRFEKGSASTRALADSSQKDLVVVAADPSRPLDLRARVLRLASTRSLHGTRKVAESLIEAGSPLRAPAYRALGRLEAGLTEDKVDELLKSDDAALRTVGAELLRGPDADERLASLVTRDDAAEVRSTAVRELVSRQGIEAVDQVLPALGDRAPEVRVATAEALSSLGDPLVPRLRKVLDDGSREAGAAAILALTRMGRPGATVIRDVAENHPDEKLRKLAKLALGTPLRPPH
jgi:hypothetical protein